MSVFRNKHFRSDGRANFLFSRDFFLLGIAKYYNGERHVFLRKIAFSRRIYSCLIHDVCCTQNAIITYNYQ